MQRGFATAAATNFALGLALFGALILLPLCYQLVRAESRLQTGLLLVPQGLGAALAIPIAGKLSDRLGARLVVPAGMGLALVTVIPYVFVAAGTSYLLLGAALFLIGAGLGATIPPAMAVAFQSVSRDAVPRASSAINAIQRVAGATGTALFAIVLQQRIKAEIPGLGGGIEGLSGLSPQARAETAPALADAFGTTFWIAIALIAVALIPALLLPRPEREADAAAEPRADARRAA